MHFPKKKKSKISKCVLSKKKIKFSKKKEKKTKEKENVVSHLLMDNWIHKSVNNNKIGIIQAKCLIKVKFWLF